ncbi:MAG: hypothetical protein LBD30_05975, partial [Verrucomicrobiales bacterium]|nr:hypothetical protein [Verrucomicrobiales bacterium]
MKTNRIVKRAALLLALSGMAAVTVSAQTTNIWITIGDGVWDNVATNWSSGAWVDSQVGAPDVAKFIDMQTPVAIQVAPAGARFQSLDLTGAYIFNGGPLQWTMSHGEAGFSNNVLNIGGTSSVTFNTALSYSGTSVNGNQRFVVGVDSTLIINKGGAFHKPDNGTQDWYVIANNATVNLSGTFTGVNQFQVTGTINHGAAFLSAGNNEVRIGNSSGNTVYNVNHADAWLRGGEITIVQNAGNVGAPRTAALNISSGTVHAEWHLHVSRAANTNAAVSVSGGLLRVVGSNGGNGIHLLQSGGGAVNQSALLAINGGTVTTSFIDFGGNTASAAANTNATATLRLTGGALYLGNNVTTKEVFFLGGGMSAADARIELGGGTVGGINHWSTSMGMTLTGSGGDV